MKLKIKYDAFEEYLCITKESDPDHPVFEGYQDDFGSTPGDFEFLLTQLGHEVAMEESTKSEEYYDDQNIFVPTPQDLAFYFDY